MKNFSEIYQTCNFRFNHLHFFLIKQPDSVVALDPASTNFPIFPTLFLKQPLKQWEVL